MKIMFNNFIRKKNFYIYLLIITACIVFLTLTITMFYSVFNIVSKKNNDIKNRQLIISTYDNYEVVYQRLNKINGVYGIYNFVHEINGTLTIQDKFNIKINSSVLNSVENIILGNTAINCVKEDIGVVKLANGGVTILGSAVDNKKLALTGKVLLNQSGFETEVSDDIKRVIWENAFVNVTLNPLTALFKCKTKVCYENKNIWALVESIANETIEIAKLDGYSFDAEKVLDQIRNICINFGKGYTPMYQDVKNKRFTEIEKLNGQIVNLAYKYKKDAPNNEFVLNAIKAIERLY